MLLRTNDIITPVFFFRSMICLLGATFPMPRLEQQANIEAGKLDHAPLPTVGEATLRGCERHLFALTPDGTLYVHMGIKMVRAFLRVFRTRRGLSSFQYPHWRNLHARRCSSSNSAGNLALIGPITCHAVNGTTEVAVLNREYHSVELIVVGE